MTRGAPRDGRNGPVFGTLNANGPRRVSAEGFQDAAATRELQESYRIKPDLTQNQTNRLVGKDLGAALAALRVG